MNIRTVFMLALCASAPMVAMCDGVRQRSASERVALRDMEMPGVSTCYCCTKPCNPTYDRKEIRLPCDDRHAMCFTCAKRWFWDEDKTDCPQCRTNVRDAVVAMIEKRRPELALLRKESEEENIWLRRFIEGVRERARERERRAAQDRAWEQWWCGLAARSVVGLESYRLVRTFLVGMSGTATFLPCWNSSATQN